MNEVEALTQGELEGLLTLIEARMLECEHMRHLRDHYLFMEEIQRKLRLQRAVQVPVAAT